eukprot:3763237-Amphidinium_carterae.1
MPAQYTHTIDLATATAFVPKELRLTTKMRDKFPLWTSFASVWKCEQNRMGRLHVNAVLHKRLHVHHCVYGGNESICGHLEVGIEEWDCCNLRFPRGRSSKQFTEFCATFDSLTTTRGKIRNSTNTPRWKPKRRQRSSVSCLLRSTLDGLRRAPG